MIKYYLLKTNITLEDNSIITFKSPPEVGDEDNK
jgi:hypothetical protein